MALPVAIARVVEPGGILDTPGPFAPVYARLFEAWRARARILAFMRPLTGISKVVCCFQWYTGISKGYKHFLWSVTSLRQRFIDGDKM